MPLAVVLRLVLVVVLGVAWPALHAPLADADEFGPHVRVLQRQIPPPAASHPHPESRATVPPGGWPLLPIDVVHASRSRMGARMSPPVAPHAVPLIHGPPLPSFAFTI